MISNSTDRYTYPFLFLFLIPQDNEDYSECYLREKQWYLDVSTRWILGGKSWTKFKKKEKANFIIFTNFAFSGRQNSKGKICCEKNIFDAFCPKYAGLHKKKGEGNNKKT